jgi:hypothetical protein
VNWLLKHFIEGKTEGTGIRRRRFNSLNAELNPIRHLLALAGAHHFVHVGRIRVKQILGDIKENRKYWNFKEESIDRSW